jgi:hypothetical protein
MDVATARSRPARVVPGYGIGAKNLRALRGAAQIVPRCDGDRSCARETVHELRGTVFATDEGMRAVESSRRDDIALAVLLLIIGVPRVIFALIYDHPVESEGALSMVCVALALVILIRRNATRSSQRRAHREA